jgi:TPR repeat protein
MQINMQWKKLLLLGAPLIIAAICTRPAYSNEVAANAQQQYEEAVNLYLGNGIKANPYQAVTLFKSAANQKHPEAEFS